jgi:hypothetical protein
VLWALLAAAAVPTTMMMRLMKLMMMMMLMTLRFLPPAWRQCSVRWLARRLLPWSDCVAESACDLGSCPL